jgi:two-component system CheB/CheR fusion protein
MPRAAIATGIADVVAPIGRLADRLVKLVSTPTLADVLADRARQDAAGEALRDILSLVRIRTGHEFGQYKRATLLRRITRRMQVTQTESYAEYLRYLREHPGELPGLLRDFLISVTNFFRDPEAFFALSVRALPPLFQNKGRGDHVRVWVAGCATGEEAYSLAILLAEEADRHKEPPHLQIFATDIDEDALVEARAGRYPDTIAADVSPARLDRFFLADGDYFRVGRELREMVLFSPHNVLRDPPFSKLDLISCRNLLIYLNRDAQNRVLNIFHFGLLPDRYLLLGASESAENPALRFDAVDGKHRIYARRSMPSTPQVDTILPSSRWQLTTSVRDLATGAERTSLPGELHHRLVERYAPPSLLVDEDLDVVHVSDRAGKYLTVSGGEPSRQLLRLVHPALRHDLRTALYAARQPSGGADTRDVRFVEDGAERIVRLRVQVAEANELGRGRSLFLVVFDELTGAADAPTASPPADSAMEPVVRQLEDELHRTRDHLRSTVEQYETSLEELKASNEELHAINEELRSATEELEASKEELQAVNEELTTLNHELKVKVDEVSRANSDLSNLMSSTDIGVLFLDRDLSIKRFTERSRDLFNVIASDIGRPLAHLTHTLEVDDLTESARTVLHSLRMIERDVRSRDGRRYLARILPYRSIDDRIEGIVITFINVTDLKLAEDAVRDRDAVMRLAGRAAGAGFWHLDIGTGRVRLTAEAMRQHGLEGAADVPLGELLGRIDDADRARVEQALRAAMERGDDVDLEYRVGDGQRAHRRLWVLASVVRAPDGNPAPGRPILVSGVTVDVTELRVPR